MIDRLRNFHKYLEMRAEELADRPCLTDGERPGVCLSYAQLNEKVNQTAAFLSCIGIRKGDRFSTLMRNCPEFFLLYLASMKMGSLIMPLIAGLPVDELVATVEMFQVKALFVDAEHCERALAAKERAGKTLRGVFCVRPPVGIEVQDFASALSSVSDVTVSFDHIRMDDPGSLYFSSGTTGDPKGIPQSPKNLLTAAYALAKAYGFREDDTQMGILPVYHTALATYGFWPSLCIGSNFVLFQRFHRHTFWRNLAEHRIAFVEAVPTILMMLLNSPEDISQYDLTALKFIGSGSAPLPKDLQLRFEDTFGVLVANKYGLSETAPTHFNPPERHRRKTGSIGKPLPMCEVKIFGENDKELAPGEIGEIVIRGDNVVSGYYNNPKSAAEAFRGGWFHTGDMGYVDEDGFFFLMSRKKEMINRGGEKIYPNEVDNVLFSHPSVAEAAAFGVPDDVYGEEVMACVKLKNGYTITERELAAHCLTRLPLYKCPKRIYFVDEIPKTASGKLLRSKLAKRF